MPKICYEQKRFRKDSLLRTHQANEIIAEFAADGFIPTLRQIYYQFVRRNYIPNNDKSYDNLGALLTDARLAGLVDWNAIEDRTRSLKGNNNWDSPHQIIETFADYFTYARWENCEYRPEVWIEKQALESVFERVCRKLDVPYFSCRGYGSASELWRAGRRMKGHYKAGKTPIIFHFGDHDPSGIDMTRDITERLAIFAEKPVEVIRVALNMDQIEEKNLPPQPAKVSDSRAQDYIDQFGDESWELDAIEPNDLMQMVEDAVMPYRDEDEWERTGKIQEEGRANLKLLAEHFDVALEAARGEE